MGGFISQIPSILGARANRPQRPAWEDDYGPFISDTPSGGWTGQGPLQADPPSPSPMPTPSLSPSPVPPRAPIAPSPSPLPRPTPTTAPTAPASATSLPPMDDSNSSSGYLVRSGPNPPPPSTIRTRERMARTPIRRPYDDLHQTLTDPAINPRPKSLGRQILGNLIEGVSPILSPLADKVTYGGDQSRRRQLQERLPYQLQDTESGQRQQQLDDTAEYREFMWLDRADRAEINRKSQEDQDFNRKVQAYNMAQRMAEQSHARPIPQDFTIPSPSGMDISLPGRSLMPQGSRPFHLPPRPSFDAQGQPTMIQDPELFVPPPDVLAREQAIAKGGKLDPMTIAFIEEGKRRAIPGTENLPPLSPDVDYTQEQLKIFREIGGRIASGLMAGYNQQTRPQLTSPGQELIMPDKTNPTGVPPRKVYTNTQPRFKPSTGGSGGNAPKKTVAQERVEKISAAADKILRENPNASYEELVTKAQTSPDTQGIASEVIAKLRVKKPSASEAKDAKREEFRRRFLGGGTTGEPTKATQANEPPPPPSPVDPELSQASARLASAPDGSTVTAPSGKVYIKQGGQVKVK
jgi:hypothetical protein